MSENQTLSQQWEDFRPSRALWFWSVAGTVVVAVIAGFTVGGWTTAGSATSLAEKASRDGRAELAGTVCVQKFVSETDAVARLEALKAASSWERDNFIEDGGWAMLAGMEKLVPGAADACAASLVAMEGIPVREADLEAGKTGS